MKVTPHQMGLKDLLAVAELTGHAPREMVLVGIQPAGIEMGVELSPYVAERLEEMIANILTKLNEWDVEVNRASFSFPGHSLPWFFCTPRNPSMTG